MINRDSCAGDTVQHKSVSPIASRTRRSSSLSNEEKELPTKKRRRSSVKRKSLVETLASVSHSAGLLVESPPTDHKNESEDPGCSTSSLQAINPSRDHSHKSVMPAQKLKSTLKISPPAGDSSQLSSNNEDTEEFKFVQDWFSTLKLEAGEWSSLLQHYKESREHNITQLLTSHVIDSTEDFPTDSSSINYKKFYNEITALEQRFSVAFTTVSACLNRVHDIRLKQEAWVKSAMKKESEALATECMVSDPKVLIEDILKCDKFLTNCSFNSSVT